ncbi:hypothetical protein KP509_06G064600 [Ceratopteris richardii]|uniref:Uncharacterized protein n=1 Tax=Ceratopteris richardii TaxID=49495 RepID=A0A8T2UL20_CERRI|nr:hypothetical protein KP509_06G064600 [Ceratopteris richardii]
MCLLHFSSVLFISSSICSVKLLFKGLTGFAVVSVLHQ